MVLTVLAGTLFIHPVVSSLTSSIILTSSGQISIASVTAASGSARDIQEAVDWIVAHGGIGTVYIPAGTFDFTPVGQWYGVGDYGLVMVPAGVNIIGASPTLGSDGIPTSWATTLRCSWLIPELHPSIQGSSWFYFYGDADSSITTRFANIRIIGERVHDYSIDYMCSKGVIFSDVMDYRVDHCGFYELSGGGIWAGWYGDVDGAGRTYCNGVIDHNRFVTTNSVPEPYGASGMVDYAIQLGKVHAEYWDDDVTNVFGHYTSYTTFIEDNYFSKWRHCVASGDGYHYVFRYNTIDSSFGFGDVDAHGTYDAVGTRAIEVYGNTFLNCEDGYNYEAIRQRGGASIITGNTNDGSYWTLVGGSWDNPEPTKCLVHDSYIWGNSENWGISLDYVENVDYFLRAPNMEDDGFIFTPYPYPHPLTLELTP